MGLIEARMLMHFARPVWQGSTLLLGILLFALCPPVVALGLWLVRFSLPAPPEVIRHAEPAPEGSPWAQMFH